MDPRQNPQDEQRRRRTIWLALIHVAIVLAILGFFVWTQAQK